MIKPDKCLQNGPMLVCARLNGSIPPSLRPFTKYCRDVLDADQAKCQYPFRDAWSGVRDVGYTVPGTLTLIVWSLFVPSTRDLPFLRNF